MMKKWMNRALWLIMVLGIISLIAWSNYQRRNAKTEDIIVKIKDSKYPSLITEEQVKTRILEKIPAVIGQSTQNIQLEKIEEQVAYNTQLADVKVFLDISGYINIKAKPRKAIIRIFDKKGNNLYLGDDDILMETSSSYSHRILVANGNIPHIDKEYQMAILNGEKELPEIYHQLSEMAQYIHEDEFLNKLIDQIYVKRNNKLILTPKLGVKEIAFGTIKNMEEKLEDLKIFYLNGKEKVDWQKYKAISLEFENQIVCSKK